MLESARPQQAKHKQAGEHSVPHAMGKVIAENPAVVGAVALAAISIFGPGRLIKWTLRGVALASLASKVAEGAAEAKLQHASNPQPASQPFSSTESEPVGV